MKSFLSFVDGDVLLSVEDVLVGRSDDATSLEVEFLYAVGGPSHDASHSEDGSVDFLRQPNHFVDESTIEVEACGSDSKVSACSSMPGSGRAPGEGHDNSLQYSFPKNPYGERSLAGYSPRGHKESDVTEQLTHTHKQY